MRPRLEQKDLNAGEIPGHQPWLRALLPGDNQVPGAAKLAPTVTGSVKTPLACTVGERVG